MKTFATVVAILMAFLSVRTAYGAENCPPTICPSQLVRTTGFPKWTGDGFLYDLPFKKGVVRAKKDHFELNFCYQDPEEDGLNCNPTVIIPRIINAEKKLSLIAVVDSEAYGTMVHIRLTPQYKVPAIFEFRFVTEKTMRSWQSQLKRVGLNLSYGNYLKPDATLQVIP